MKKLYPIKQLRFSYLKGKISALESEKGRRAFWEILFGGVGAAVIAGLFALIIHYLGEVNSSPKLENIIFEDDQDDRKFRLKSRELSIELANYGDVFFNDLWPGQITESVKELMAVETAIDLNLTLGKVRSRIAANQTIADDYLLKIGDLLKQLNDLGALEVDRYDDLSSLIYQTAQTTSLVMAENL